MWSGIGLVLLSTVIYGATPAIVAASRGQVSIVDLIAYRSALAAVLFLILSRSLRRRQSRSGQSPTRSGHGVIIGAVLWGPQVLLFYASFEFIDTSLAVAISFIYPTLVLVMGSILRRERPNPVDLSLSVLALVGIAVLLLPGGAGDVDPAGVGLVLLAACGYAAYVLCADRLLQGARPFEVGAEISIGAVIWTVPAGLVLQRLSLLSDPRDWVVVATQAVLMVAATTCYYGGLRILGSGQASLVDTVQPVVAMAAGGMLLGESMGVVQVLGVALVMTSVAVSSGMAHRRTAAVGSSPR